MCLAVRLWNSQRTQVSSTPHKLPAQACQSANFLSSPLEKRLLQEPAPSTLHQCHQEGELKATGQYRPYPCLFASLFSLKHTMERERSNKPNVQ